MSSEKVPDKAFFPKLRYKRYNYVILQAKADILGLLLSLTICLTKSSGSFSVKMDIGERIKFIRGKMSQKEFAAKIGSGQRSIHDWEAGKASPGARALAGIHKAFKVNVHWLLTGEGDPYLTDGSTGRDGIRDYLFLPLVEGRVTAGADGGLLYDRPEDHFPFKYSWIVRKFGRDPARHKALVLVRVTGESMMPTINPGELILVDTWEPERLEIKDGKIYLARMPDGTITVKRLMLNEKDGKVRLVCLSDNPSFEPFKFEVEKPLQWYVLGRIRWVGREID